MTEIIPTPVEHIAEYDPVAAGLADLRARFEGATFDCTTTAGDKAARVARMELRELRGRLEAKRVEIKAPALAYSRLIDSEAKRIEAEIRALEEPIDAQVKAEEARKEAERAAKAEAERQRIAGIRASIDLACLVGVHNRKSSRLDLEESIAALEALTFGEEFAELVGEADSVRSRELANLRQLLVDRIAADEEAAKRAEERAELARQRAKQAEDERIAREKLEAEQAAERERLKAEREAQEAARKKADEEARLAREEADRKAALKRAEDDRLAQEKRDEAERALAAERAAIERDKKAAREAAEKREREERAERERLLAEKTARDAAESRLRGAAPSMVVALQAVQGDANFGELAGSVQELVLDALAEAIEA